MRPEPFACWRTVFKEHLAVIVRRLDVEMLRHLLILKKTSLLLSVTLVLKLRSFVSTANMRNQGPLGRSRSTTQGALTGW